jgi:transglutaminase/protease-like cytokinesis protein 3
MGLNTLKKNTISYKKFKKKELKFKMLKVLTCNFNLHVNIKVYGNLLLYISQEKLDQNRCFISGNSSSVYKP